MRLSRSLMCYMWTNISHVALTSTGWPKKNLPSRTFQKTADCHRYAETGQF